MMSVNKSASSLEIQRRLARPRRAPAAHRGLTPVAMRSNDRPPIRVRGTTSDATVLAPRCAAAPAARWRLPSSTTVRNERICASMPNTDAGCASPQSVLGITRPRAGILPWVNYATEKYIMTTALEAMDKDFERMMQMLTGFFVTQIAGAV